VSWANPKKDFEFRKKKSISMLKVWVKIIQNTTKNVIFLLKISKNFLDKNKHFYYY